MARIASMPIPFIDLTESDDEDGPATSEQPQPDLAPSPAPSPAPAPEPTTPGYDLSDTEPIAEPTTPEPTTPEYALSDTEAVPEPPTSEPVDPMPSQQVVETMQASKGAATLRAATAERTAKQAAKQAIASTNPRTSRKRHAPEQAPSRLDVLAAIASTLLTRQPEKVGGSRYTVSFASANPKRMRVNTNAISTKATGSVPAAGGPGHKQCRQSSRPTEAGFA